MTKTLVTLSLLAATVSSAASTTAKNRCSDAIRAWRRGPSMSDLSKGIAPTGLKGATAHFKQISENWQTALKLLAQVPKGELDRKDPELAECFAEHDKWKKYMDEFQVAFKKAEDEAAHPAPVVEKKGPTKAKFITVEGYGNYDVLTRLAAKEYSARHADLDVRVADMLMNPQEFLEKWRKAKAAMGADAPELEAPEAMEHLKALQAKVDGAAPGLSFPALKDHDSGLEAEASRGLKEIYPRATVKKTAMDAAGWTIEQNALGVPTSRFRSGQIEFQLPGYALCAVRTFNIVEAHAGGGKYEAGKVSVLPSTRFVSCM